MSSDCTTYKKEEKKNSDSLVQVLLTYISVPASGLRLAFRMHKRNAMPSLSRDSLDEHNLTSSHIHRHKLCASILCTLFLSHSSSFDVAVLYLFAYYAYNFLCLWMCRWFSESMLVLFNPYALSLSLFWNETAHVPNLIRDIMSDVDVCVSSEREGESQEQKSLAMRIEWRTPTHMHAYSVSCQWVREKKKLKLNA